MSLFLIEDPRFQLWDHDRCLRKPSSSSFCQNSTALNFYRLKWQSEFHWKFSDSRGLELLAQTPFFCSVFSVTQLYLYMPILVACTTELDTRKPCTRSLVPIFAFIYYLLIWFALKQIKMLQLMDKHGRMKVSPLLWNLLPVEFVICHVLVDIPPLSHQPTLRYLGNPSRDSLARL